MDAQTTLLLIGVMQFVVGPIALAVVAFVLDRRAKNRTAAVEFAITNGHPDPLREDLDSKFKLVFSKLDHTTALQKKQGKVLVAMRSDIAELFENDAEQLADVQALREEIAKKSP